MARFSSTTTTDAIVAAERSAIWAALTDPVILARLTPLLKRVVANGDLWRWELGNLSILGTSVTPVFTERMVFTEGSRIDFHHEPPADAKERAGADGWYALDDRDTGTHLAISLTLHVDLPLSRLAAPAVQVVMKGAMQATGDRFGSNLEHHLGLG